MKSVFSVAFAPARASLLLILLAPLAMVAQSNRPKTSEEAFRERYGLKTNPTTPQNKYAPLANDLQVSNGDLVATNISENISDYRVFDGVVIKSPEDYRVGGYSLEYFADAKKQGWYFSSGTLVQLLSDRRALIREEDAPGLYLIKNIPPEWSSVADGKIVQAWTRANGIVEYTTVLGANSRVNSFDCGTLPTKEQFDKFVRAAKNAQQQKRAEIEKLRLEERERQQSVKQQAAVETDQRLLKFQRQKASDGNGYAQYEMGLRYLNGRGVETNRALAIQWFHAACTNGYSDASNQLFKLSVP